MMHSIVVCARLAVFLSYLITTIWSSLYLLNRVVSTRVGDGALFLAAFLAAICLSMLSGLWVLILFSVGALISQTLSNMPIAMRLVRRLDDAAEYVIRKSASTLFGVDLNETEGGMDIVKLEPDNPEESIYEKLDQVEKSFLKALSNTEFALQDHNADSEKRLGEHEERIIKLLKTELSSKNRA